MIILLLFILALPMLTALGKSLAAPVEAMTANPERSIAAQGAFNQGLALIADKYFETHDKPQSLLDFEAGMKASKALTEMKEADAKGLPIPTEAAAIWKAYETARMKKI